MLGAGRLFFTTYTPTSIVITLIVVLLTRLLVSWLFPEEEEKPFEREISKKIEQVNVDIDQLIDKGDLKGIADLFDAQTPTAAQVARVIASVDPRKNRFAPALLRTLDNKTKVAFLLDQSASVTEETFNEKLKPAAMNIADSLKGLFKDVNIEPLFCAVAYGKTQVVGDRDVLYSDLKVFKELIRKHTYPCVSNENGTFGTACTPTHEAMEKAAGLLDKERDDSLRIIFNFTDGDPDDGKNKNEELKRTKDAFDRLDHAGVVVVGVGIGSSVNELKQFSTPGFVVKVDNFDALDKWVKDSFKMVQTSQECAKALLACSERFAKFIEQLKAVKTKDDLPKFLVWLDVLGTECR